MSIHPSLKSKKFGTQRNVRKRWERVQKLERNENWLEKNGTVYGLPTEKIRKIKIKLAKEKEEIKNEDKK